MRAPVGSRVRPGSNRVVPQGTFRLPAPGGLPQEAAIPLSSGEGVPGAAIQS